MLWPVLMQCNLVFFNLCWARGGRLKASVGSGKPMALIQLENPDYGLALRYTDDKVY